ncbi:MAG: hypothetical protein ABIH28_01895, partial [archaeon]
LLVILSTLLFLVILAQGFFLTFYFSLDYNTVNFQLHSVASELLKEQGTFLENFENNSVLIDEQISKTIEEKYYKDYDCGFLDCIKKTNDPFSLVSKNAQNYWRNKSLLSLLVLFILAGIVFLLVEHKSTFFLLSSILFGIASLFFLELNFIAEFISNSFFAFGGDLSASSFLGFFSVFLVKSPLVFNLFLGTAILLLVVWLVMKFLEMKSEFSELFNKVSGWFKKEPKMQQDVKKILSKKKYK